MRSLFRVLYPVVLELALASCQTTLPSPTSAPVDKPVVIGITPVSSACDVFKNLRTAHVEIHQGDHPLFELVIKDVPTTPKPQDKVQVEVIPSTGAPFEQEVPVMGTTDVYPLMLTQDHLLRPATIAAVTRSVLQTGDQGICGKKPRTRLVPVMVGGSISHFS